MQRLDDVEACVDAVIAKVGSDLRIATPLAIGKPNHLLNAFYRRAKADTSLRLTILTALTLERPKGHSDLERRFLEPFVERVWGDYPDLEYELDRAADRLPINVRVIEFYLYAGKYLKNATAQRDYVSTNYTYVARDLMDRGVNVLAQQVARRTVDGDEKISLSCNPDVSLDMMAAIRKSDRLAMVVAQVNDQLPFMCGDAAVDAESFDAVVDDPEQYCRLFGTPKTSVTDAEYMIGLYASTLIKDGGELQIGIGSLGDALVYALKLRHENNSVYREALERLGIRQRFGTIIDRVGDLKPFERGLFAATEMLVDGFMHLIEAGIVKRRVYDDVPIQRLLNSGTITEKVTPETLGALCEAKAIQPALSAADVEYLKRFGILRDDVTFVQGRLVLPDGESIDVNARDPRCREQLRPALGESLSGGCIVHAGFFLGPEAFYQWLRDLPEDRRRLINMRSVTKINQLYGHEELDRLHRADARFVNTGMMVTLGGAVVSDGLESGAVVSGVGGQYNFVAMAHALPDGRSILQIRSTHGSGDDLTSSVVWNYGHTTIPRHQRDIIVTEYGIADLRGRTDEEVIETLLTVTDSRFQAGLQRRAEESGKLRPGFALPKAHQANLPETYTAPLAKLKAKGLFPAFPFGTDLTDEEIVLGRALRAMKSKTESKAGALEALAEGAFDGAIDDDVLPYLERMRLAAPGNVKETLYQRILAAEIRQVLSANG